MMSNAFFHHGGYPGVPAIPEPSDDSASNEIVYGDYAGEEVLPEIVSLIEKELSEPYIIYTYRYFLQTWPNLCRLAYLKRPESATAGESSRQSPVIGVIVSKLDRHNKGSRLMRGYIAMLSVHTAWRGRGIAKSLVKSNIENMISLGAQEIILETEVDNHASLALYESLDFVREKCLFRFYLNGKDAYRLVYAVPNPGESEADNQEEIKDPLQIR